MRCATSAAGPACGWPSPRMWTPVHSPVQCGRWLEAAAVHLRYAQHLPTARVRDALRCCRRARLRPSAGAWSRGWHRRPGPAGRRPWRCQQPIWTRPACNGSGCKCSATVGPPCTAWCPIGVGCLGRAPGSLPPSRNLARRARRDDCLRFMVGPAVLFTNNRAERAMRPAKWQIKISGGRTKVGARCFAHLRGLIEFLRLGPDAPKPRPSPVPP